MWYLVKDIINTTKHFLILSMKFTHKEDQYKHIDVLGKECSE